VIYTDEGKMLLMRLTLHLFLALKKDVSIESPSEMLLSMDDRMHFLHWRYIIPLRYSIVGLPVLQVRLAHHFFSLLWSWISSVNKMFCSLIMVQCWLSNLNVLALVNLLMAIHPKDMFSWHSCSHPLLYLLGPQEDIVSGCTAEGAVSFS
jgi:hypothetical protein